MPNVVFRPRVSERTPSRTWFAELCTAPGPQVIGVTGDNSFDTLFGREWLLEWSVEDDTLRLYQESLTHPGEWERITTPLPPVFDAPLPATARRVTFCFDQSARIVVAVEDEGVIKVTRWDPGTNQYVQNVSFAGVDPALAMDATWAYDIPNSDVLIFYLSTDRTRVMCRVQRELYAIEHEMWDYGQQVILDRALPAFLRYQLLVADSAGAPLEKVLLSDPYPYLGHDWLEAAFGLAGAGTYLLTVINAAPGPDQLVATTTFGGSGTYGDPIVTIAPPHSLLVTSAALTGSGTLEPATLTRAVEDPIDVAVTLAGSGEHRQAVLNAAGDNDVEATFALGSGGTYDPA